MTMGQWLVMGGSTLLQSTSSWAEDEYADQGAARSSFNSVDQYICLGIN